MGHASRGRRRDRSRSATPARRTYSEALKGDKGKIAALEKELAAARAAGADAEARCAALQRAALEHEALQAELLTQLRAAADGEAIAQTALEKDRGAAHAALRLAAWAWWRVYLSPILSATLGQFRVVENPRALLVNITRFFPN